LLPPQGPAAHRLGTGGRAWTPCGPRSIRTCRPSASAWSACSRPRLGSATRWSRWCRRTTSRKRGEAAANAVMAGCRPAYFPVSISSRRSDAQPIASCPAPTEPKQADWLDGRASKGPPCPPNAHRPPGSRGARFEDVLVPKFPSVEEILIVVAGRTAGRFSAMVPGWMGARAARVRSRERSRSAVRRAPEGYGGPSRPPIVSIPGRRSARSR
jgi:hypothetical protein